MQTSSAGVLRDARHRPDGLSHGRRPVRDAGDPAVAGAAYNVTPAAMGFAVNASTMGMAVAGLAVALVQPADRPPARHPRQPGAAVDPDRAAGGRAGSDDFHDAAHRAGALHGVGLHADAGLSRRECSAADAGGAFAAYITGNVASNLIGRLVSAALADHLGLAANFYLLRGAQSRRRRAGLFHHARAPRRWRR